MTTTQTPAQTETEIKIGVNTLQELPALIQAHNAKHPLLVHGHRPVEDGLLEKVRLILNQAGIAHSDMGQILPNPKFSSVKRGVKKARQEKCDLILSLGGGSTLQCAKGIAYGLYFKEHDKGTLWDLWAKKAKPKGAAPVAAILTNPASGAELNEACTLVKDGKQATLNSPYGKCAFAILDPTLSVLAFYPTMNQVFGIFTYVFVRYLNAPQEEAQQDLAILKKLLNAADGLEKDENDLQARSALFEAGIEAHKVKQSGSNTLGNLADKLAFKCSLPRGTATSAIFFAWLDTIRKENGEKLDTLATELFGINAEDEKKDADAAIKALKDRVVSMKLAVSIPDTGLVLTPQDLKDLADTHEDLKILEKANRIDDSDPASERNNQRITDIS